MHLECPSQDPNVLQLEKEKEQELRANSKITDGAVAGDDSNDVTASASDAASNDGVCSNQLNSNEPLPDEVLIGLDNISVDGN